MMYSKYLIVLAVFDYNCTYIYIYVNINEMELYSMERNQQCINSCDVPVTQ